MKIDQNVIDRIKVRADKKYAGAVSDGNKLINDVQKASFVSGGIEEAENVINIIRAATEVTEAVNNVYDQYIHGPNFKSLIKTMFDKNDLLIKALQDYKTLNP